MEEGMPKTKIISSTVASVPAIAKDRSLPIGIEKDTENAIKAYYISMGVKEILCD